VPRFLTEDEYAVVVAAADRMIPPQGPHPGGARLGVAEYIDRLLAAFTFDPPLIHAGGPFSGRAGGDASFARFLPLSRYEELAWRTRIEGSLGLAEREFNGPVRGWQQIYRAGLAALGPDFTRVDGPEQDRRLHANRELRQLLYEHACEGAYGAPEYGGNRDLAGWSAIGFPGDSQPRGYTDEQVRGRA
jgi:Gluconate 2-dehydrogenase subunit 3